VTPNDSDTIDLDHFLPYRLSVLANVVSATIAEAYRRRFDLSIPEWRVIAVLSRHPGLSAARVAALTGMDAVAVSRAVARLLRAGRLSRSVSVSDRRRSVLSVSPAGAAVYREVAPLALDYERELLEALDRAQRIAFEAALNALTARAHGLADNLAGREARARSRPARR
jgi:DNA-binding MarR family transcriptional regulator